MFKISKEKRIAKKIKEMLNERGFIVNMHVSKRTRSVYLKIDNGACGKIRISDHKNNLTSCKFNVIKNYNGKRYEYTNGVLKKYYNYNCINKIVLDVEIERANIITQYGYNSYKKMRDKQKNFNAHINFERKAA